MTKEEIGNVLRNLRIANGKTQKEVAELLGRKQQIVGHWETGYSQPDANTLFTICELYGTTVDNAFGISAKERIISEKEFDLVSNFRSLDSQGQSTVRYIMDNELKRCQKEQELYERVSELENKPKTVPTRIWAYYGKIAAAGTFVDFVDMIAGTKEYPVTDENKNADYTIGVSGDSMEPLYHDGDIVFVKQTTDLSIGDIGIFQKDNGIYIKEVGNGELISRNSAYGPIKNNGGIRCLGKVIAKAD